MKVILICRLLIEKDQRHRLYDSFLMSLIQLLLGSCRITSDKEAKVDSSCPSTLGNVLEYLTTQSLSLGARPTKTSIFTDIGQKQGWVVQAISKISQFIYF